MLGFAQSAIITLASFLFVLTFVVTVHELGHFLAARSLGVAVDRFSIGFGRAIASWRDRSGVEWRIGWIPLGGYVRFKGDENAASVPDQNDLQAMREWIEYEEGKEAVKSYFHFKPLWQRAVVVAAGPFANFVLASALFAVLLGVFGEMTMPPRVTSVEPGSAAQQAGFVAGDLVKEMDGKPVRGFEDIAQYVQLRAERPIDFLVERGGRELHILATPARTTIDHPVAGRVEIGMLGIGWPDVSQVERVRYAPLEAVVQGVKRTGDVLSTTVFYLGRLIQGEVPADQLGGFIGIADASGKVAKEGARDAPDVSTMILGVMVSLLGLTAVLSVSIGFMNLLPVPVLDGGHLLFYAYEAVARRPLASSVQAAGYRVGLALLLGFMLFATWNDLQRLRVFNFLGGLFS
ncbi:MAG TPA: RIP metalloprotease [Caulobacteraceae bacterium]|nr:RIP metalloprotease [Caulobacteraceae bacterium]